MDLKIILLGLSNLDFVIKKKVLVSLFQFEKIIVIVILVIVLLVMLVIVLKIMCMLILVCVKKVFNFLLRGRSINNSTREWKDLFKCQMKSGAYSDTPFLVVTAALLQSIIPIAIGQQWSLFNRFKSNRTTTTKSVNAEETVRKASRASATNEDHNFVS